MELAFATRRLRTLCVDHDQAVRAFGHDAADALRTRLADLRAATYLADLPLGHPEVLGSEPPCLRFELRGGLVLEARVSHATTPRTNEGDLDTSRVRRVLITEVNDV